MVQEACSCMICQAMLKCVSDGKGHVYSHLNKEMWPLKRPITTCEYFCKADNEYYEKNRRSHGHGGLAGKEPKISDRVALRNPKRISLDEVHWLRMERPGSVEKDQGKGYYKTPLIRRKRRRVDDERKKKERRYIRRVKK